MQMMRIRCKSDVNKFTSIQIPLHSPIPSIRGPSILRKIVRKLHRHHYHHRRHWRHPIIVTLVGSIVAFPVTSYCANICLTIMMRVCFT